MFVSSSSSAAPAADADNMDTVDSHHPFLSPIALGKFTGRHPVSTQSFLLVGQH